MAGRFAIRAAVALAAAVCASILLGGCAGGASTPQEIVYPPLTPTAKSTARSSTTATPVDPALTQFCSEVAAPLLDLQVGVLHLQQGGGSVSETASKAAGMEALLTTYASSTEPDIAAWLPTAIAYMQALERLPASSHKQTDLTTALGTAGAASPALDDINDFCSGQPGWE